MHHAGQVFHNLVHIQHIPLEKRPKQDNGCKLGLHSANIQKISLLAARMKTRTVSIFILVYLSTVMRHYCRSISSQVLVEQCRCIHPKESKNDRNSFFFFSLHIFKTLKAWLFQPKPKNMNASKSSLVYHPPTASPCFHPQPVCLQLGRCCCGYWAIHHRWPWLFGKLAALLALGKYHLAGAKMASGKPHAAKDFFAFVFGQSSQSRRNGLTTYLFLPASGSRIHFVKWWKLKHCFGYLAERDLRIFTELDERQGEAKKKGKRQTKSEKRIDILISKVLWCFVL